jgi:hypothetical protein
MKLNELKSILATNENVEFELPSGELVETHFHVTEVGQISKHFVDCGGTLRTERVVNFQLWVANDTDHSLKAPKLLKIIDIAENMLGIQNDEIEVEYQQESITKYGLDYNGTHFVLTSKQTACLASDACGIPSDKLPASKTSGAVSCIPGGGCC